MFFVKAIVLFAVLNALPEHGWLDRLTLAWTVVVGALLWSGVQLRWVWTRQLYYVPPPAPPAPRPSRRPRYTAQADPEIPPHAADSVRRDGRGHPPARGLSAPTWKSGLGRAVVPRRAGRSSGR